MGGGGGGDTRASQIHTPQLALGMVDGHLAWRGGGGALSGEGEKGEGRGK
jgi:hypothetical protein